MKGSFEFLGTHLAQNENILKYINNFLNKTRPKNIIEIGTYYGGLSIVFQLYSIAYDSKFVTFDIKKFTEGNKVFSSLGVDQRIMNVFENIDVIEKLVKSEGTSLVFCDGGNKIKEFNLFSDFLKPGDYILAHDYARNFCYFLNFMLDKTWNWAEIMYKDIDKACQKNNLVECFTELQDVAIVCRKKM
jgi:cephalosporin hydroxylase